MGSKQRGRCLGICPWVIRGTPYGIIVSTGVVSVIPYPPFPAPPPPAAIGDTPIVPDSADAVLQYDTVEGAQSVSLLFRYPA
ncbi:hypothetical protein BJX99DRAFT_237113 [Aspergillus californicus]